MSEATDKPRRCRLRRAGVAALALVTLAALAWALHVWWTDRDPRPATEIYRGVAYGCDELTGPNGRGLIHWVRVDLSAPGVEVFATPLDPDAVAQGWQYRTAYVGEAVERHGLAVAINGTYFARASRLPRPGTLARGHETLVASGVVSHEDPTSFMLWFDGDGRAHFEPTRPAAPGVLERARWGIGGNLKLLERGEISRFAHNDAPDAHTVIGVDQTRSVLVLAVMESASQRRAAEELRRLGAADGLMLDGGSSSEMAIGADARGVRPGSLIGTWVPVANHFGVRARKLE